MVSIIKQNIKSSEQVVKINSNLKRVSCDGRITLFEEGEDALGHPKIYLKFDENNSSICPYCGCKFMRTKS